ncbi:hypothetical protein BLL52_4173 [Rhodoferax antarcticus ANT.BR]|uniref:Uncharacterized protein n=1 Tax=Rhodoferax antarcticus ANT.BR TaxID=1111071 RepID=A0A1Q8Y8U0_9BURK|nr:hypothetical protein BLL52_4173 [Rhodoferax antarcticus ANT.BR]
MLDDGTMFLTLPTLDELDRFWKENKKGFAFAAKYGTEPNLWISS